MRLSSRVPRSAARNELTHSLARVRARRQRPDSPNRTRHASSWPTRTASWLRWDSPAACNYEPEPLGVPEARQAVAADQRRRGAKVDPDQWS